MDRAKNNPHLLPVSVIEAAAGGNVDAINAVLKHYEQYISVLATRRLYDENVLTDVIHLILGAYKRKYIENDPANLAEN